ncbi:MAG: hypothetical protein JNL74_06010 [Fibrobacteres bacterium]|nr:hypothetical protein [Fibrobacterota bacterium]
MMTFWKQLELETKILILSALLLFLLLVPLHFLINSGIREMASLSVDKELGPVLMTSVQNLEGEDKEAAIRSLERFRQWQAAAPLLAKEQKLVVLVFSTVLIILLLAAYAFTLRQLTRPLKKLTEAAHEIGQNRRPEISTDAGGAVGTLQRSMKEMSLELDKHRTAMLTEGMEKAWRDMARIMAHEIKNPLTPVRLTMDRFDEKIDAGKVITKEDWSRFSERVGTQLDQLEKLVTSFSSFAKEPEARNTDIDPRSVLERIAEGFKGRIEISFQGVSEASADPLLLQQIGLNIIKNAAEAGATSMVITLRRTDEKTEIFFHDNGPGVPENERDKIFIPYVTGKSGGTGLGLAVVKRLVESMHGSVTMPPNKDKGLLIKLTLRSAVKSMSRTEVLYT